jgi:hypothetical protein
MVVCDGGEVPGMIAAERLAVPATGVPRDFVGVPAPQPAAADAGEDTPMEEAPLLVDACVNRLPVQWPDWNFSSVRVFRAADMA